MYCHIQPPLVSQDNGEVEQPGGGEMAPPGHA